MIGRPVAGLVTLAVLSAGLAGCHKAGTNPQSSLGPYAECRSIIEFIRSSLDDPDAMVLDWGPREEVKSDTGEVVAVVIEARYTGELYRKAGTWSQKFRIQNRRVSEETSRTAAGEGPAGRD
jgi:hypothetical protein